MINPEPREKEQGKDQSKKQPRKFVFKQFESNCGGVLFIRIADEFVGKISVLDVSSKIFQRVVDSSCSLSRFISRMVPAEWAGKASLKEFEERLPDLLKRNGVEPGKTGSWYLHFKLRNNTKFKKTQFLEAAMRIVPKEIPTNYDSPEATISVEISNHLMCLSILPKFKEFKEYSLHFFKSEKPKETLEPINEPNKEEKEEKIEEINENEIKGKVQISIEKNQENDSEGDEIPLL